MDDLWNLRGLDLFAGLSEREINTALQIATTIGVEPGDYVFRPGDPHDRLYLLHHGRVKTFVYSETGQEKILHVFFPGDAFGGLLLPVADRELPWAQAMDDVVVSFMDKPAFRRFMDRCPDLFWNLFRHMCRHHAADMRRLQSLLHTKATHRLIHTLLHLGERLGHDDVDEFDLEIALTHEDLANMIGVVRPTVSEAIGELREAGVLCGEGRHLVVDRRAAEQFLLRE